MLSNYALLAEMPSLAHIVMYEVGLQFVVVSLCFTTRGVSCLFEQI